MMKVFDRKTGYFVNKRFFIPTSIYIHYDNKIVDYICWKLRHLVARFRR